jgi:hypothetical protein
MYAFKITAVLVFLLIAAVSASAQEEDESDFITPPKVDSPQVQDTQEFDVTGNKMNVDSVVTMGADTILQADTTTHKGKKHTAAKAVFYSAILPGLGQAYNKKYWKIPIIYAGFGGLAYALYYTSSNFNESRAAYRAVVRGQFGSYLGYTDAEDLKYFRDQFKNFLNLSALGTVLWYGLNLIDAAVDGHLYSYNMDDKLSFNFDPSFILPNTLGMAPTTCLGLSFNINLLAGKRKAVVN